MVCEWKKISNEANPTASCQKRERKMAILSGNQFQHWDFDTVLKCCQKKNSRRFHFDDGVVFVIAWKKHMDMMGQQSKRTKTNDWKMILSKNLRVLSTMTRSLAFK